MSESAEPRLNCEEARAELPALLYEELAGDAKQHLEGHLRSCAACRAELEEHRRTMQALDQWSVVPSPSRSAIRWVTVPRNRFRDRLRPALVGTAAAMIAFAALSLFGVTATYTDGQLSVSVGRGAHSSSEDVDEALAKHLPEVQAMTWRAIDARIGELFEALEADLVEMGRTEEQRRQTLVRAVDERWDADLRRFAAVMEALATRQEQEARKVQSFEEDMMAWRTSVDDQLTVTPGKTNAKEES